MGNDRTQQGGVHLFFGRHTTANCPFHVISSVSVTYLNRPRAALPKGTQPAGEPPLHPHSHTHTCYVPVPEPVEGLCVLCLMRFKTFTTSNPSRWNQPRKKFLDRLLQFFSFNQRAERETRAPD